MNQYFDTHTKAGTAGGTLLSIFANIHSGDILKTAILAAIGAVSDAALPCHFFLAHGHSVDK